MTISSVEIDRDSRDATFSSWEVVATKTVYKGTGMTLNTQLHGTAASRGKVEQFTGAAGEFFAGFHPDTRSGARTGESPVLAGADLRDRIMTLTVAGLTGDRTDHLLPVYMTDGATFTLTRPTAGNASCIGVVINSLTSAAAEVLVFGMATRLAAFYAQDTFLWHLGSFPAFGATGNILTGIPAPCHGKFGTTAGDVFAICAQDPADADVAIAVNLEIGGVDVTGGVVSLSAADTQGLKIAGTAVTGTNEFHEGDLIDVEFTTTTAGTANDGHYNLYAKCYRLPGV